MIKFIKEHIGEIAFSLIVIICTCFFVHIITLGTFLSSTIEDQAIKRAEFYSEEQSQYIESQFNKMIDETEYYARKVSEADTKERFSETVKSIKTTGELNANENAVEMFYSKDGKIIKYDGSFVNDYPEINELAETQTTRFSNMFQYENNVRVTAVAAKTIKCEYADAFIVLFDGASFSISDFTGKDGNAETDCFSRADFTLLVKNDGIIIDRVVNSDRFDIGTTPVGKGILNKIFTDRNTLDKTADALNGKGVASFIFMNDVDKYVLTINAFGADHGGISLIGAFRISNVYVEGYNIKESIWSSLIGTGLLMIVLVASMIISRKIKKREIFRLEMIDPVLNCSTPKKFGKDAHDILKRHSGTSFAFVSFRINNFTYILKKFGDTETQKFSKFVAATIRQALLLEETFAYGGEGEFLILLHFKERQNFTERLNAIYLRISSYSVNDANGKYNIGVSCSVYEAEQSERASVRNMLEKLKIVKATATVHTGSFSIDFYEDLKRENYIRKAEIESRMESALENSEFHLFYQPKYNLKTKNMDGSEILIRWYDPKIESYRGPNEFLPVFEENGFIANIDKFVLYKACENIADRIANRKICYPISVNVSRVTATQPDFTDYYIRIKNKFNIKDNFITLEFTESFAYENYQFLSEIVTKLHENGFLCSIDDFGTGYSSYNILKTIEMDEIKLDKFFLSKGLSEERDLVLLKSVIELVNQMGVKVTQEGVETREDLYKLDELGCDVIQGFYFAKPMKYVDYIEFIDKNFIKKQ